MFYNTINATDPELRRYRASALTQEQRVLRYFEKFPERYLTPTQVLAGAFPPPKPPLTSIRRAITSLTEDGKLVKTDKLFEGDYGKPQHAWRLK